jgi:hypothetical protein
MYRGAVVAVICVVCVIVAGRPTASAAVATIALDGIKDASYRLIATDPPADMAAGYRANSLESWAELSELYAFNDEDNLYIYVTLPSYSPANSSGQIGLAIDVTGDVNASGGATDPWTNGISFAYTGTQSINDALLVTAQHAILPDYVIRGRIRGTIGDILNNNDGHTELWRFVGGMWEGTGENWGGILPGASVGTHIAYASQPGGVEIMVPFAEIGLSPGTPLRLQFFTTRRHDLVDGVPVPNGAYDTLPSDDQSSGPGATTTQRILARYNPLPPNGAPAVAFSYSQYAAEEAAGAAPITLTLSSALTQTVSLTVEAVGGTASASQYALPAQPVEIPAGQMTVVVWVSLPDDDVAEEDVTVILEIDRATNAWLGEPVRATLIIVDDDEEEAEPPPPGYGLFLPVIRR